MIAPPGQEALSVRLGNPRLNDSARGEDSNQVNRTVQQDADTSQQDKLRDHGLLRSYELGNKSQNEHGSLYVQYLDYDAIPKGLGRTGSLLATTPATGKPSLVRWETAAARIVSLTEQLQRQEYI